LARHAELESLQREILRISEQVYGVDDPHTAIALNNLTQLLKATNRLTEAEPLQRKDLLILLKFTKSTGHLHPNLQHGFINYQDLLNDMKFSPTETQTRLSELGKAAGYPAADLQSLQASLYGE
jgi:hypothetical protein